MDVVELSERWASSYDCWIDAPGTEEPVYACPYQSAANDTQNAKESELTWPDATRNLLFPLFGFTASNPLGNEKSSFENENANKALKKDLQLLSSSSEHVAWWNSFAFGPSWQEKGFIISAERSEVARLAKKYNQGAIYEFILDSKEDLSSSFAVAATALRKTIPVLIPDVEADIRIIRCQRPPFASSDPKF
mmetsp:Transcript_36825/g.41991  ORF Transcript_36825/g.41991 Transcript_36825/m.41991 type:complete len:192 (+) Transcript_36825:154-729(+)